MQKKLRAKGQRVYGLGYSLATKDSDSTYLFNQFLVAYGGGGIVTPDGKLHVDDPKVRKAAINALTALTTPYKEGFVPPGAINWGDPDNNNAFYAKQIVMTPNATISIAVAQMEKDRSVHATRSSPSAAARAATASPSPAWSRSSWPSSRKAPRTSTRAKDFLKYLHPAEEPRPLSLAGARPLGAGHAVDRQE